MPAPFDLLPPLLTGLKVTLLVTLGGGAVALPSAFVAGLARRSPQRALRGAAYVYVEVFRGTSALVQLFWVYFTLPLFGVRLEAMTVGIVVLGLNGGAYGAEIVRGAVSAVPRGQLEAAAALNLTPRQARWLVVVPQALIAMLPPFGNLLIEILKASALVSLITLSDLTFRAQTLRSATLRTHEIFGLVLVLYFLIATVIARSTRALERRLAVYRGGGRAVNVTFDWAYAAAILPDLLRGLRVTVEATLLGTALAMALGLLWALVRRARLPVVTGLVSGFVELVRRTPLLVQLFYLFYGLPALGVTLSPILTGVLGLGLHYSAYTAEVYRAGLDGVPRGQWEAARALNLTRFRTYMSVVLPQAIPPILPALGNYAVAMFKETPLLSAITVLEMLQVAKILGSESFRYLEPLTLVGILFLIVSLISSRLIRRLEVRLGVG